MDCAGCVKRINGVTVALRNTPFDAGWHDESSPDVFGKIADVKHKERIEVFPKRTPKTGRYLKIWLPKREYLTICEVEVIRADGEFLLSFFDKCHSIMG